MNDYTVTYFYNDIAFAAMDCASRNIPDSTAVVMAEQSNEK